jgi:hypothetical protein
MAATAKGGDFTAHIVVAETMKARSFFGNRVALKGFLAAGIPTPGIPGMVIIEMARPEHHHRHL